MNFGLGKIYNPTVMPSMENILDLLPLVGLLTFIKIVWEYVQSLRWKKSEFLAKEIKEFQNDPDIKIVFQLLDWNAREVEIRGEKIVITDKSLATALETHETRDEFEIWEANLRDIFDKFFDKISMFEIYVQNGLIREKELFLYLGYYINILSDEKRKPKTLLKAFDNYLEYYQFVNVKKLMESLNKNKKIK